MGLYLLEMQLSINIGLQKQKMNLIILRKKNNLGKILLLAMFEHLLNQKTEILQMSLKLKEDIILALN